MVIEIPHTINKNGFESLPVLSHITGNLYVGCSPCYWIPGHINRFHTVFNLYAFENYPKVEGQVRYDVDMRDSNNEMSPGFKSTVEKLARDVNKACKFGPTLVHCQMGINRSNLVVGLALMLRGMSAQDAIQLLRDKRSEWVLMNRTFEKFLLQYGEVPA